MEINFNGKRALVTGAGKGIGREIVKALCRGGAEVYALSRTQSDLDSLKEEFQTIHTLCVELSDWQATRSAVTSVLPVDLLVNNAGITSLEPFLECKEQEFDKVMNVNAKSVLNITQVVAKDMVDRKQGGSIVNVSSLASMLALNEHIAYSASKGALDMMTKTMALELGKHQIRVNSVNPTVTMTAMGKYAWSEEAKAKPMLDRIPLGRFVEVEDIVNTVMFLLSDKATTVNGTLIPIDGGFSVS